MPARNKGKARETEPAEAVVPLGKQLAHTDKKTRDGAVANLIAFLSEGGSLNVGDTGSKEPVQSSSNQLLSPLEMRKLWKGLFYCFWMSDKPLVQQRLAQDLSDVLLSIKPRSANGEIDIQAQTNAALDFIAGFWEAIVREWAGIDRLRMDKYYMLIRRWQNATFRLLQRSNWDAEAVKRYNEMMVQSVGGPMSWSDPKVSISIAWHLSDVWLEELEKILEEESTPCPLADLLNPFTQLLACTTNPKTHDRLIEAIYEPLLSSLLPPEESDEPPSKKRKLGNNSAIAGARNPKISKGCSASLGGEKAVSERELADSVLKSLMKQASAGNEAGVKDSNRRKIYTFVREKGGVDNDDDDDE